MRVTQGTKKPTWWNTLRYSTTSAYSATSLPERPGCPSSSHPTSLTYISVGVHLDTDGDHIIPRGAGNASRCKPPHRRLKSFAWKTINLEGVALSVLLSCDKHRRVHYSPLRRPACPPGLVAWRPREPRGYAGPAARSFALQGLRPTRATGSPRVRRPAFDFGD